ncbi:hypothetical protein [Singulisphaera sp. PoT]|uniref:hypothetical protein n=1 Tax=Singulisphaera sp. PoT TaxID=3411797 RepID=UPI003BF56E4E
MGIERIAVTRALGKLSTDESVRLHQFEGMIRRNMRGCFEFATALLTIRDKRLYREGWRSFEHYCEDRWHFSARHVNRLIQWAEVITDLGPRGPVSVEPEPRRLPTETQSRPLSRIEPDMRLEAWDRAVKIAGGSQPSERQVRQAVEEVKAAMAPSQPVRDERAALAKGRDDGPVPIHAEVTFNARAGEEPAVAEVLGVDAEPSEAEWLASLPARKDLSNEARRWFDADAIAFRRTEPHRRRYIEETREVIAEAKRKGKHIGPWMAIRDRYLRLADPSRWVACKMCDGTGRMELIGKCAACKGHAYLISGDQVKPLNN